MLKSPIRTRPERTLALGGREPGVLGEGEGGGGGGGGGGGTTPETTEILNTYL